MELVSTREIKSRIALAKTAFKKKKKKTLLTSKFDFKFKDVSI
jgi:hypothetical protein